MVSNHNKEAVDRIVLIPTQESFVLLTAMSVCHFFQTELKILYLFLCIFESSRYFYVPAILFNGGKI